MTSHEENQVRDAFGAIHLPEDIEARALVNIEAAREKDGSEAPRKRRGSFRLIAGRRVAAIAACVALVACVIGGVGDFLRPVAYVGIDVNPSVELSLNRFDVVVGASALNEGGQRVLDETPCMWRQFDDAACDLDKTMRAMAGEGSIAEVSIDCDDESRYAALASRSGECFGRGGEAHCGRTTAEERQSAHDAGMGVAKYRAYLALEGAGASLSAEECASLSMHELHDLLEGTETCEEESDSGDAEGVGNAKDATDAGDAKGHRARHHAEK